MVHVAETLIIRTDCQIGRIRFEADRSAGGVPGQDEDSAVDLFLRQISGNAVKRTAVLSPGKARHFEGLFQRIEVIHRQIADFRGAEVFVDFGNVLRKERARGRQSKDSRADCGMIPFHDPLLFYFISDWRLKCFSCGIPRQGMGAAGTIPRLLFLFRKLARRSQQIAELPLIGEQIQIPHMSAAVEPGQFLFQRIVEKFPV